MRLVILGLSGIAQRRVLPALRGMADLEGVDVASRKLADAEVRRTWCQRLAANDLAGEVFADYRDALDRGRADVVYVSLVNSEHGRWTEAALRRRLHVVVDKPAFLGVAEAERMLELAAKERVCLTEATVFGYHPLIPLVRSEFVRTAQGVSQASVQAGGRDVGMGTASFPVPPIARITATFSFPPMDDGNFRYRRFLGGGALWDLGPYAAATGRLIFGQEPTDVACRVLARGGEDEVEIAFSTLQTFACGQSLVGHFGFDTAYRNRLEILTPEVAVEMDRVFTSPPDAANAIRVTRRDGSSTVDVPPADAFREYLNSVLGCIATGDWAALTADLGADARTLQRLRYAAER